MVQLGSESEPWFGGWFVSGRLAPGNVQGEKPKIAVNQQQQPLQTALYRFVCDLINGMNDATWDELVSDSTRDRYFRGTSDVEWETLVGMRCRTPTCILETDTPLGSGKSIDDESTSHLAASGALPRKLSVSFPQLFSANDPLNAARPACSLLLMARVLGVVSTLSPLVVLLEQAQNADAESLGELVSLLDLSCDGCASTQGLLVVLLCRSDMELPLPIASLQSHPGTLVLALSNLTRHNVNEWIQEFLRGHGLS
jgi:hypothetical protein